MKTRTKIRLAALASGAIRAARRVGGAPDVGVHRRKGLTWELDLREGIDFSLFLFGAFEPDIVATAASIIPDGATVLDVGANVGAQTLPLARAVGARGRVHALEPTDYAFAKLVRNVALNPELGGRISLHQIMLAPAAQPRPAGIWSSWPLAGDAEGHPVHKGAAKALEHARLIDLDTFAAEQGIGRVDLIKLDVDGSELRVIESGQAFLARHRPAILMEFAPYLYPEFGYTPADLFARLRALGYRCRLLPSRREVAFDDLPRQLAGRDGINVLLTAA